MELDDLFARDLRERRAELDQREEQLQRALRQLQVAGQAAYDALQRAGHTSGKVALGIDVTGPTIRKLKADGEKTGWRPLSKDVYGSLDGYTVRRLERSWELARLRDAVDTAAREVQVAKERLEATSARADRGIPSFDLGILFIPGLPERRAARELRQFGDALAASFVRDRDGEAAGGAVEVVQARLTTDGDGPARLVLQPGHPGGDRGGAEEHRWLAAVSPADHDLADDRDLREFMRWFVLFLPWFAADVFDRRLAQARCVPGAWPRRFIRASGDAVTGLVGVPLLLLALLLALLCQVMLLLPIARVSGRVGARLLVRGLGLTFALARSEVLLDAQVNRAARHLAWLEDRCDKVAVVAHGQGVVIADRLARRAHQGTIALLVTLGSSLRRSWFARELHGHPDDAAGGLGGLLAWFLAAICVAVALLFPVLLVVAILSGQGPLVVFTAAATAVYLVVAKLLSQGAGRILRASVLPVRLRAAGRRATRTTGAGWLDLASAADPVADGAYLAAAAPLGEVHVEVAYHASVWADHLAYLEPGTEALRRLVAALARLAPAPARPAVASAGAASARDGARWLVAARRTAILAGVPAAIVLLERVPGPAGASRLTDATFVLLWVLYGAVAFVVTKGSWLLWDYSKRGYEVAAAAGAPVTILPVYAGLALFLEAMAVALAWPLVFRLGGWGALARDGAAIAAFFHHGDPLLRSLAVVIEAVLALFAVTAAFGFVLSRPVVRHRLERRRRPPDPVAAAAPLLRLLPSGGLDAGGGHYRALPIAWDVSVRRLGRPGRPSRCTDPARMLLRGDAVVLDLRDGCLLEGEVAHVHGRKLYWSGQLATKAADGPRLASGREWCAFRRDLPELLEKVARLDPSGGYAAEWARAVQPVADGEGLTIERLAADPSR